MLVQTADGPDVDLVAGAGVNVRHVDLAGGGVVESHAAHRMRMVQGVKKLRECKMKWN